MQRLHHNDLAGYILENELGWDTLILPARYEKTLLHPLKSSLGFKDPRQKEGELLWPDRFGETEIRRLEKQLGAYGAAGQLQQRPTPAGGGLIKTELFKLWPADDRMPRFSWVIQAYDTAYTEKTSNDPSACGVFGVFEIPGRARYGVMLLDCWAEHLDYPDLRERLYKDYFKATYGPDEREPDEILIEAKGSGQSVISDLGRMRSPDGESGINIRTYNPGKADKTTRVHLMLPQLEDGLIWVPESKAAPGSPASWAIPMLNECARFPKGEHDDLVDVLSMTMIRLKDMRMVSVDDDDYIASNVVYYKRERERRNPYAA